MLKQKEYIATAGRDKGKKFLITEMPSYQAETFCFKVLSAMGQSGVEIDVDASQGAASLITKGLSSIMKIRSDLLLPLLDEMMDCVQVVMPKTTRPLVDSDIEEIMTRFHLRAEVIKLHTDFFSEDDQLTTESSEQAAKSSSTTRISRQR